MSTTRLVIRISFRLDGHVDARNSIGNKRYLLEEMLCARHASNAAAIAIGNRVVRA